MASRNQLNTIALVVMAKGMARVLLKHFENYHGRKKAKLLGRLSHLELAADNTWNALRDTGGYKLSEADALKIAVHIRYYEKAAVPDQGDPAIITSAVLGLLNDALDGMAPAAKKNRAAAFRYTALEKLQGAMNGVHGLFDAGLAKPRVYQKAESAIRVWKESAYLG